MLSTATQHNPPERAHARRASTNLLAIAVLCGASVGVAGLVAGAWTLMGAAQQFHLRDTSLDGLPPVDGPMIEVAQATRGRAVFLTVCASCHGPSGRGVTGLGKDLVASAYCRGLSDADLAAFVRAGRAADDPKNTTKVAMPPSGGNPSLTDPQVADAVAFLRGLQNKSRMPALAPATAEHVMETMLAMAPAPAAATTTAAGGAAEGPAHYEDDEYETDDVAMGARYYAMSCVSCHGADANGLPNLGKSLRTSEFVKGLDDDALIAFLGKGRSTSDPMNTTKVDMPPRGGNPALNDDRLFQVVAYLRWLPKHPGKT